MKCWIVLIVLTTLAAPGCVILPAKIEEPPVPPVNVSDLTPPPPITPEQVNENNTQESFQRLSGEVERAQSAALPGKR
jgi:hypothetical protein